MPAPIAIFIFDRPDHLRTMIESLQRCELFAESPLFVFGDGPNQSTQRQQVDAARTVAQEMLGDRATYFFSETNKGLARSIIDGVAQLTQSHGRVIVVEDDLVLHPYFLKYMNDALSRYADDDQIYQVSGHCFNVPEFRDRPTAVMLPMTTTWGWGTWARAWQHFEEIPRGWEQLQTDKAFRKKFNLGGVYDYAAMLEAFVAGRNRSWGVRFYWSVFRLDGLSVFPPMTLVRNNGMDGSGTHGRGMFRRFGDSTTQREFNKIEMPQSKLIDADFLFVKNAIFKQNGGMLGSILDWLKTVFKF